MGIIFTSIYRILKKRRVLFFFLFLGALAFVGYFASQIKLEEDITKMMPTDAKIARLNTIFQNSKFLDRLVVTVSLTDSTAEAEPEKLIEFSDILITSIQKIEPLLTLEGLELLYRRAQGTVKR